MNRRDFTKLASSAAVCALAAPAQAARPLPGPFQHSEIYRVWEAIDQSRDVQEVADLLRPRFGSLPWMFKGAIRLGAERDGTPAYREVAVQILDVRDDVAGRIIGVPRCLVEYEIIEPIRFAVRHVRPVPYQRGAM